MTDTWSDHISDEPDYVQRMVRWFFERYAAAAVTDESLFYAEDVLDDKFSEEFDADEIAEAVDFIGEWGDEWKLIASERDTEPPDEPEDEIEDEEPEPMDEGEPES